MAAIILEPVVRRWECPSCGHRHVSQDGRPHTPMHPCPKLSGIQAPYVEVTGRADCLPRHSVVHRVIERQDWVGDETGVAHDESGRAVMAIHTERADGHDTHVFAPMARADQE